MRKLWLLFPGVLLIGGSVVGARFIWDSKAKISAHASQRHIVCYRDPMHPWYTSDRPGTAPDCGMPLEPVYAESPASSAARPTGVMLSSPQQELIGVTTTTVKEEGTEASFRTLGRVTSEENRVYSVSAGTDGWIREVYLPSTGAHVEKDAPLARLFSRELLTPEQSYLYALDSAEPNGAGQVQSPKQAQVAQFQLKQAAVELGDIGLAPVQLDALERTKKFTSEFEVRSPISGFVLSRNASPGQRISKGSELYRIADLRRVWILADISGEEAGLIRPGDKAVISLNGKEVAVAQVAEVLPQFDAGARTLRVRLEAENPHFTMRPEMFMDVTFKFYLPPSISIPADAVIDSGLRKIVFVMSESNVFTRRTVQTGWRFNDRVQITDGLQAGDRIVTSGNFLIDSESRMKASGDD